MLISALEIFFISSSHCRSEHLCLIGSSWSQLQTQQIIKLPHPVLKPHLPTADLANHQMAKQLPRTQMGTLIKASSLWALWVLGEREGGGRRQDYAGRTSHCQIGSPHAVLVRILGSTSDSKSTAISTFGQRSRRHLWEDKGIVYWGKN